MRSRSECERSISGNEKFCAVNSRYVLKLLQLSAQEILVFVHKQNKKIRIPSIQPLFLQCFEISTRQNAKLLGLYFDQKLTWTPLIKILKAKCTQALGVIKYLSHHSKGCNRKILLQLYKSLIRSRLDYGAPIYDTTSKSTLKLLDPIQSHALRVALVAFRTSPGLSLRAEAAEPSSALQKTHSNLKSHV